MAAGEETLVFRDAVRDDLPHIVALLANDPLGSKKDDTGYKTTTLGQDVFTRGKFRAEGLFDARAFIPNKGKWWYGNPGEIPGH